MYLADADDDQVIGDSDDVVLWHVVNDEGVSMPTAIGGEPDGADVIVPMTTQLQDDKLYALFVTTSEADALLSFTLDELGDVAAGEVRAADDTNRPITEFRDRAADTC